MVGFHPYEISRTGTSTESGLLGAGNWRRGWVDRSRWLGRVGVGAASEDGSRMEGCICITLAIPLFFIEDKFTLD